MTASPPSPPSPQEAGASGAELLRNGGFDGGGSPAPDGWFISDGSSGKGRVSLDRTQRQAGQASLKLEPNNRNGGDQQLSVGQIIPAGAYRGQQVEFSAYLRAEGAATAVLGMLHFVRGQPGGLVGVHQPPGTGEWVLHRATYSVPDDPTVQLVLACTASGQSGAVWFDSVSVRVISPTGARAPQPGRTETAARAPEPDRTEGTPKAAVEVKADVIVRRIPRTLYGTNVEWIWNANGLWQEGPRRVHPELLRLSRELGVTVVRYPGGLFSDFYHWRNGVGPFERRPEAQHEP
ncbi:MAG: hypothetical protein ACRD88_18985, partial [Terriglobia bacterium]